MKKLMDTPNVLRNIANELPPIYFLLFFFFHARYIFHAVTPAGVSVLRKNGIKKGQRRMNPRTN